MEAASKGSAQSSHYDRGVACCSIAGVTLQLWDAKAVAFLTREDPWPHTVQAHGIGEV